MSSGMFRYDIEGLRQDLEISLQSIRSLYQEYFKEMAKELKKMENLLYEKQWELLQRKAHNVKGVSINLGLKDIFEVSEKLDLQLKQNEYSHCKKELENIRDQVAVAQKDIEAYFADRIRQETEGPDNRQER